VVNLYGSIQAKTVEIR